MTLHFLELGYENVLGRSCPPELRPFGRISIEFN
jgi:hypothetical protein